MTALGDLTVSPIGLGCAAFSLDLADDPGRASRTIEAALAAGVTLLDTALAYTPAGEENHNERLIRRVLGSVGQVVVATKGGHYRDGDTFPIDGRPATLVAHCERSLRALGVDRIDCYHLHWPDPRVPIEDSVGALAELREAGKIAEIGVSNVTVDQVRRAQRVAPIASVQDRLSLFDRSNMDVVEHCRRTGVTFLAYSPLGGAGRVVPDGLATIAGRHGVSPQRVALAWLLAQHVVPIVGATRPEHAVDAAAAASLTLTAAELAQCTWNPPANGRSRDDDPTCTP